MIETYNNVTFMVRLLLAKKMYEKTLGYDLEDNSKSTNMNLFSKRIAMLVRGISLKNNIC